MDVFFPPFPTFQSLNTTKQVHTPPRLKSEPGGVSSVSSQRAERPHDELETRIVNVPQVDVFMGDLHGALPIDVQVRGGHKVHIESFWGGEKNTHTQIKLNKDKIKAQTSEKSCEDFLDCNFYKVLTKFIALVQLSFKCVSRQILLPSAEVSVVFIAWLQICAEFS